MDKYNEALERARICYKDLSELDGTIASMAKDFFEEVFPELKMCESDMIREELIKYFKINQGGVDYKLGGKFSLSQVLNWLEKQKEQKQSNINIDSMVYKYANTRESYMGKSVNCMIRAYRQGLNDAISTFNSKFTEFNKEDEEMLNRLIDVLEGNNPDDYHEAWEETFLPWLKSLKIKSYWKPTDDQLKELRNYTDNVILRNLYYDLKKLKYK